MKKIAGAILFLLAFNCFISSASALNLEYYEIKSTVKEDMTVSSIITLSSNSSVDSFDYKLKYAVYKLEVRSYYAPIECKNRITDTTTISCNFTDFQNYNNTKIEITFDTNEMNKKADNDYDFSHFVPMEMSTKRFFNIVYLPPTSTLVNDVPNESFSPRNGQILSDGKHIMVYWERENVEKGEDLYFSINYKLPSDNIQNVYSTGIMVVIAVIIIASLGIYYVRSTRRQDSVKVLMPLMKGDEKVVIEILNKNGGSVNQKVIVRESDFSKAKVSRIIAGLKERGVVGVESMGRTNKITLKIKRW